MVLIRDKIYIDLNDLGSYINDVCNAFTYSNPEVFHRKRLRLSVKNIPQRLFNYRLAVVNGKRILQIPRGGLSKVLSIINADPVLKSEFIKNIVDDRTVREPIDIKLINTELENHQIKIRDVLLKNEGGLIQADPGAGKTIAVLSVIAELKQPTLILLHEHRLASQWRNEIQNRLDGNFTLGRYDGDTIVDGDIVVAIINTAYNMFLENSSVFDGFGTVVVDECHHVPAHMFMNVVNNIPAKYRIGVTGTVKRRDGMDILMYDIMGKVLIHFDASKLKNRITDFDYKMVNTNIRMVLPKVNRWTGSKKELVFDVVSTITKLTKNEFRNNIIIKEVIECIKNGYFPLILSDRIEHNKYLYEKLTLLGYKAVLLIGQTRKHIKWEEIRDNNEIDCIVANTKIASEGLDLPRLSALILTCPTTNLYRLKQQIGRIRRVTENKKKPLVVDFCDNVAYFIDGGTPRYVLLQAAIKRAKFYSQLKSEYHN